MAVIRSPNDPFVLPRRVQVGPFWWTLERDGNLDAQYEFSRMDTLRRNIRFAAHTDALQTPVSLIHELLHCTMISYLGKDEMLSEEQIVGLANGFAQALQSLGLLPERMVLEGEDG